MNEKIVPELPDYDLSDEIKQKIKAHDKYYYNADDSRSYNKGAAEERELISLISAHLSCTTAYAVSVLQRELWK